MIETTIATVTPELASHMLSTNTHNRPMSKAYVRELSADLQAGRWVTTHQGVAFDVFGNLLDGQHRLAAIVHSGVPAELLVTHGVPPEAFQAIDQVRRRTAGQILTMAGVSKDAPRLAAMARVILGEVEGHQKPSSAAVTSFAAMHQAVLERYLPVSRKYGPAVGAAFAWSESLGWDEVGSAASRLVDKLWFGAGDPMRALDRRSETFANLGQGAASMRAKFAVTVNALLAVHEERDLHVARSAAPDYARIARTSTRPSEQLEANRAAV